MMRNIKIVSDGIGYNTKVFDADGNKIEGITSLKIEITAPNDFVKATLEFENVELDIMAKEPLYDDSDLSELVDPTLKNITK